MITFTFDIKKTVQIINQILRRNRGSINYTKLIKLLYIADKDALSKYDTTITGDKYCAMDNGPVLSEIYDLIRGKSVNSHYQLYWDGFFCKKDYDLILVHKNNLPGDKLSAAELEILDSVDAQFKKKSYSDMIKYVHNQELFPEIKWDGAKQSSIPLPVEEILAKLGRSESEIEAIEKEITLQKKEAEYIAECCV
jgi:uncharacterized phage-associated protein